MVIVDSTSDLTTLSDRLTVKLSPDSLDDTDKEWLLFIEDHKFNIISTSTVYKLSPTTMSQYEYHIKLFMDDLHIDRDMLDIIMIINEMKQELDFVNLDHLYIPDRRTLVDLRRKYVRFKKAMASAQAK